jgi:hypothetical protein
MSGRGRSWDGNYPKNVMMTFVDGKPARIRMGNRLRIDDKWYKKM